MDAQGRLALELMVQSRATPANPILLAIRTRDGETQAITAIQVQAGGPAAMVLSPPGSSGRRWEGAVELSPSKCSTVTM